MDENQLIQHLGQQAQANPDQVGIGDDCCIWTGLGDECLSVDSVVEGVHFDPETPPEAVGRKAVGAALSDLAAMGAIPTGAAVALHLPSRWSAQAVMAGVQAELQRHQVPLLGGDTCRANELVVSVTVWGAAVAGGRLIRRGGAGPGDLLLVTGRLGGSLRSGRHLRPEPRLREGQWLACRGYVHAMMDLSDGLAADLPRLCAASGCGAVILADRVPVHDDVPAFSDELQAACCDGEDFELLIAIEAAAWPQIKTTWPFDTLLAEVGWCLPGSDGLLLEGGDGRTMPIPWSGYEHRL